MSARLLVPPSATYEEWKAARAELSRTAVTASEIAIVLGISPWSSAFNLYHQKLGTISGDFDDDTLSLGRHLEPWIADRWETDHPEWHVMPGGLWANNERPWQMATTDRDLFDDGPEPVVHQMGAVIPDSVLEIKSSGTYEGWGEDGSDDIPAYYRAQVLWQLDTLGLAEAHVTCFFLATRQRRDYVVGYDEADVKLMRDAAREFLDRIERRDPPEIDWTPATTQALKDLYPLGENEEAEVEVPDSLAERYRLAVKNAAEWQQTKKQVENELRAQMRDAKRAVHDGQTVATRSVYDVAEHVRSACTVDKLTPARAKKEKP